MKLYDYAAEFAELFDSLGDMAGDDDLEQAWFDTLESIEAEFEDKAENVAAYIKQLKGEADMLREQGFRVMGAAAVVGRHTYGEIQVTRPDAEDLSACADFARRTVSLPDDAPEAEIPGNRPYREGGNGGKFRPYRGWGCTGCDRCRQECPVNAIADNLNEVRDTCISCFRCIRHCPLGAKQMVEPDYFTFAKAFTERLSERRENEWFGAAVQ